VQLLARDLNADALVILTDVESDVGAATAHPTGRTTPGALGGVVFPAGSMGPKREAAYQFVEATAPPAIIGILHEAAALLGATRATIAEPAEVSASAAPAGVAG
jgi:carbamate kinase